jgi:hypothetical protein
MTDEQKCDRAMAALDTMAALWAEKINLRDMVQVILSRSAEGMEDRVIGLAKQAHIEGLFAGRESNDAELDALRADAARYRWLAPRLIAADFDYNESGKCALVFEWPSNVAVGGNCDQNVDAAIAAQGDKP